MSRIAAAILGVVAVAVAASTAQAHDPFRGSPPYPHQPVIVVPRYQPLVVIPAEPAYTLDCFAREFRPVEGRHHITVIHPVTNCPVDVCFELPCGKLEKLEVKKREIHFDFGRHDVRLIFRVNGTVDVKSN